MGLISDLFFDKYDEPREIEFPEFSLKLIAVGNLIILNVDSDELLDGWPEFCLIPVLDDKTIKVITDPNFTHDDTLLFRCDNRDPQQWKTITETFKSNISEIEHVDIEEFTTLTDFFCDFTKLWSTAHQWVSEKVKVGDRNQVDECMNDLRGIFSKLGENTPMDEGRSEQRKVLVVGGCSNMIKRALDLFSNVQVIYEPWNEADIFPKAEGSSKHNTYPGSESTRPPKHLVLPKHSRSMRKAKYRR